MCVYAMAECFIPSCSSILRVTAFLSSLEENHTVKSMIFLGGGYISGQPRLQFVNYGIGKSSYRYFPIKNIYILKGQIRDTFYSSEDSS